MLPASSNRGGSTSSRRGGNPEAPATHQAAAIFPAGRQHITGAALGIQHNRQRRGEATAHRNPTNCRQEPSSRGDLRQGRQHIKPAGQEPLRHHQRRGEARRSPAGRHTIKPRRSPRQGGSTSPARLSGNQHNRQRRGDLPGRQQERRRGGNHHRRSSNTRAGGY